MRNLLTRIDGLEGELDQARRIIQRESLPPAQGSEASTAQATLAPLGDPSPLATASLGALNTRLSQSPNAVGDQASRTRTQERYERPVVQQASEAPEPTTDQRHRSNHVTSVRRPSTETSQPQFVRARLYRDLDDEATASYDQDIAIDYPSLDHRLHMWPHRFLADKLVDNFFNFLYPQYPFLHGPTFRARYEALWTSTSAPPNVWSGTVNLVFALGCHSTDMPPDCGKQCFLRARSLIAPQMISCRSLESLQALILLSLYLQSTNRTTESWNVIGTAVRVSQALDLHSSDASNVGRTTIEQESRKRAYWGCFLLDSVICLQMGRRSVFNVQPSPVDLPACADDDHLLSRSSETSVTAHTKHLEGETPSFICFFIATIQLSQFMHEVVEFFEHPEDQHRIFETDRKMCEWLNKLPRHLHPSASDPTDKRLKRQKGILMSRYLQ